MKEKELMKARSNNLEMVRFNDFIDTCDMKVIPVVGRKFTWYRLNGTSKSRLDSILVTDEWIVQWLGFRKFVLSRQVSDHCALVVKNTIKDWGLKPFRTFDVWKHSQGFKEVIRKSWANPISSGNRMVDLKVKLKGLKKELNLWKKEVFSTYTRNKELVAEIERIDRYDDEGNLQEDLRVRRVELLN